MEKETKSIRQVDEKKEVITLIDKSGLIWTTEIRDGETVSDARQRLWGDIHESYS